MRRNAVRTLILFVFCLALGFQQPAPARAQSPSEAVTVLLSAPGDPYFSLAQEIAAAESLPLHTGWKAALEQEPQFVLWVISPARLSDAVMIEAGLALKQAAGLPGVGLITGNTLEQARDLWQRAHQVQGHTIYAANGEFPTAGIDQARLISFEGQPAAPAPLTEDSLAAALQQADYLTFTGHGSSHYLRLDPETTFEAADLPDALPPVVVSTASCQTFRLWQEDSIAMAFIARGAAAYAGFVYSPMEGYLIGQFDDLPMRYTWPDFPIGTVLALQTRGTLQSYASFPFLYLIGDPRLSLQPEPPYRLVSDTSAGGSRSLTYSSAPAGLIPVRVPGGSRYRYVEIPGVGAAADGDFFYNSRLQLGSLGDDKVIIFIHPGGDFTVRLQQQPPWYRPLLWPVLQAFDHLTLFTPQNGGDAILVAAGGLSWLLVLWRLFRARRAAGALAARGPRLAPAFTGLLLAGLLAMYMVLRLPLASITSKPLAFHPAWLVGVFMLTSAGAYLYWTAPTARTAPSWFGRAFALAVAVFPALAPAVFVLAIAAIFNLVLAAPQLSTGIYSYQLGLLPLVAAGVEALVLGLVFHLVSRSRIQKK